MNSIFGANWKTTASGLLTAVIGAAGPLTAYFATLHQTWAAEGSGVVTLTAAIATVWLHILMNDAPAATTTTVTTKTTEAIPATSSTTTKTQ